MKIKYTLTAPLSHIGETSSTGSIFQTILTSNGRIPVITGNSIRGTLRDCGALHLLNCVGFPVDKTVFNVLFSGGTLAGASKLDVARAKAVREHFPLISILGGGLGTMLLGGKVDCGFAYPICRETETITGFESDISWHSLIEEIEFTRTDDAKNDKYERYITNAEETEKKKGTASQQMRYSVQYLAAGTELIQKIFLYNNVADVEKGALLLCFAEWFKHPKLGGMGNKGFGTFKAKIFDDDESTLMRVDERGIKIASDAQKLIDLYTDSVMQCGEYIDLLGGK